MILIFLLLLLAIAALLSALVAIAQGAIAIGLVLLVVAVPVGAIAAVTWVRREVADNRGFRKLIANGGPVEEDWRRKV